MNRRDELYTYLLERDGFPRPPDYNIVPAKGNENGPPPLSFAQERFWFLDQFDHIHPIYNGCKAVRLIGELHQEVLVECLNLIVRRHEVLHTTYPAPEGTPIVSVARDFFVEIPVTDLRHVTRVELARTVERLAREEWKQPINFAEELPIRARLLRIRQVENLLLLTLHQIASDSHSVAVFFRELWISYKAKLQGREPELPDLPLQYGDFATWQRRHVSRQSFQSQREYWLQRLSGILPVLNLPTDMPRPAVQRFEGSRISIQFTDTLQLELKELSRANGVTLFVTLLAAFKTLLYRYTTQEDLLVGCPVLNRTLDDTANLIGSFVNTLVLRTNYSGTPSFREVLRRVRETCLDAFVHQDFPFEKLVEELQPQRDLGRNPIFQVMFAFQNTAVPSLELDDLRSETVEIDGGMTKFDLTVSLTDKEHGISGYVEYSTDLFYRETIERMRQHFHNLLEAIVSDPDQSIATVPILTEAERHHILVERNDTAADYPKEKCIHHLFEDQVKRTPETIAVEFEDQQITYGELNQRANQLAHHLVTLGIGPEKLVGVCIERSIEMVVGLLGILKAGGAYVPLDPGYPKERLRFMLQDSQVSVLLTTEDIVEDRKWMIENGGDAQSSILNARWRVVCLDRDRLNIEQQSSDNPTMQSASHNLAYVIYTSGSTGKPKGVQIEHRSVINCLIAVARQIELMPQRRWLAVTTISFDIAALEIFAPLVTGTKLVLTNSEESGDATRLIAQLKISEANIMQATPSMWQLLFETGWQCPAGFTILCGGEALTGGLADRLSDSADSVWNLYGPTESTIWSTITRVAKNERSVPIGRPIANTQVYILDPNLQPVPIGVPGELYIGGDGLARGYLNRPELTAEKFIRNSFSQDTNSRLYRTGDLTKHLADGRIQFLGRIDNQVKIRGHRVELAEIETVLIQHPAVVDGVVVAYPPDSLHERSLIGYVVPKQKLLPSIAELRGYLNQRLPDYMVPSVFVTLDTLPLTPNGKTNRNALPPPERTRPELAKVIEPRSELEQLVAQLWCDVLKLDTIGPHDNFFELGGHSLLATRVVARLRAKFKIDLPLRKLFELPTVAELAEHIEILRRNERGISIPPITALPHDPPIPLAFSQRRLWFLHRLDPGLAAYNMPATFDIKGVLEISFLERALNDIINRHESLRTRISEVNGNPYQEVVPALKFILPVIDLTHLSQTVASIEVKRIAVEDGSATFNLETAPLMRAKLLRLSDNHHVFILNFHHIMSDGSSVVVFFQELAMLYDALLTGKPSPLTPLAVQFPDYCIWQNEILQSPQIALQLQYWRKQLDSCESLLNLPTDYRRNSVVTYSGARRSVVLSDELTRRLRELGLQEGATIFMILLAGFYLLLSRHSGQRDLIVGATVAGRNHPEIERLIGFFVNVLPLRAQIPDDITFLKFVHQVRETCLDAYTHQDVPFERIIEEVRPARELGRQPLVQVLFNLADVEERSLRLTGCEVIKLAPFALAAKYELVLSAPEIDGKIQLNIAYNTELFSENRITVMLRQFEFLLSQAVADPTEKVDQISLLAPTSDSVVPNPTIALGNTWHGPVYEKIASHASFAPNRVAVIDTGGQWTYEEINDYSLQFAADLAAREIQPGDLVVVYAHRSASLVTILLGILRAGAVFVILDPAYPPARLIDLLRIAHPKGWIQMSAAGMLPEAVANYLPTLDLSCHWVVASGKEDFLGVLRRIPVQQTNLSISADTPAYVAFTSGTTGQPKAVLCRHGSMTHFLPWQERRFGLGTGDRFSVLSGLAYNYLQREIFTALWIGATVHMPSFEILQSPGALRLWLHQNEITVLHLTPALAQFLAMPSAITLTSVQRIFCGGDVLTKHTLAILRELAPNARITNLYGATETQRASAYFEIPESMLAENSKYKDIVPLGRGVEDVQLLLLTTTEKLAGIGEIGELFVRSPHLALGYMNDEPLTRDRFLINPFGTTETDRMFRTGELARYLPNGDVERVGRNDRRVNIRGFRVELEEIEVVLKQHPAVSDVAVHAFGKSGPDKHEAPASDPNPDCNLVAYIVSNEEDSESLRDLLYSYVSARLPGYMVPLHFVVMERFPLNPNGKVDYRALAAIPLVQTDPPIAAIAPRNATEAQLCNILSQVLGQTTIRMNENFFRIGGHSLLAVQALVRIQEAFGITIDLRMFLDAPTIAAVAEEIEIQLRAKSAAPDEKDIEREEIEL